MKDLPVQLRSSCGKNWKQRVRDDKVDYEDSIASAEEILSYILNKRVNYKRDVFNEILLVLERGMR